MSRVPAHTLFLALAKIVDSFLILDKIKNQDERC